ncbi:hypothetical protein DWB61_09735 [Ancylomarina euxinus]|uniref:Uncharacterized protein n=1 Tax=Ancylomarina euxinus TaxID=2283627 RepID=A0A425Y0X5_9BACT|nr:class I lanthipeptide [Ancylomarina euxinus]MCZ4693791.1 class I lanthipeptide [Ancylomarina euxinus]MUP15129.1 hypothetical protein [Ancylomarina euxinus]RRG21552.1 hypothetical protein DWB61_09735 [Ancylomarina euxinus]
MKKLSLKKTIISNLTDSEQEEIQGGLSSRRNCTGFLCCNPEPTQSCPNCTNQDIKIVYDEELEQN